MYHKPDGNGHGVSRNKAAKTEEPQNQLFKKIKNFMPFAFLNLAGFKNL